MALAQALVTAGYARDINHQQWLATVSVDSRRFVDVAIAKWDAQADFRNKWSALGWDERDSLVQAEAVRKRRHAGREATVSCDGKAMIYSQETCRLARASGFEEKDLHDFGRLLEGLVLAAKVEEQNRCVGRIRANAHMFATPDACESMARDVAGK